MIVQRVSWCKMGEVEHKHFVNLYLSFVMPVYSFKPYNVRVIITKFLIVKYECLTKQIGDGNKAHDYTRGIYSVIDIVTPTQGAYLFQVHLRGSLIEIGGGEGGLFNLEIMMVSVLHNELEYKVEKLK